MGLPEKYIIAQISHSSASIAKAVYDHIISERQSGYALDIANLYSTFNFIVSCEFSCEFQFHFRVLF